ncbi:hypothetical protein [Aeromicrobium sp. PE09-221]|uniref:hypothetical protein n=1 Tax=Aeromicrobium sp. PE09-221 TaxID=1898043 RepID=UPI001F3D379A|nr:hypothetical protein [Aeromicrobium sp. PE09-221]
MGLEQLGAFSFELVGLSLELGLLLLGVAGVFAQQCGDQFGDSSSQVSGDGVVAVVFGDLLLDLADEHDWHAAVGLLVVFPDAAEVFVVLAGGGAGVHDDHPALA